MDWRFGRELTGHEVSAVHQRGWTGINNGELLKLAEAEFDVFLTIDRNLPYQRTVSNHDIAIVVMLTPSSRITDLRLVVPNLLETLKTVTSETVTEVGI